jgi:hypothetical protein
VVAMARKRHYIEDMRAALLAGLGLLLTAPLGAFAGEAAVGPASATASPAPRRAASPAPGPSRLNLGPYAASAADDPAALLDELRFHERVEVRGKAMDSASLTAKLEWWMKDIDLTRGATPATMSAPSIQEMRNYRPHPADAVNLVPVMQWLAEKIGGKKKD